MGDNEELKYSQVDMDNITAKVKEAERARVLKETVALDDYNKVVEELNKFKSERAYSNVEKVFLENGGNRDNFQDYIKVADDLLNKTGDELVDAIKSSKEAKSWAFVQDVESTTKAQDTKAFNDLMRDDTSDLVEGTIYKKNF